MYTLYYLRLKCLVRKSGDLLWLLCFPLILATLFHAAFSNLGKSETFQTVPVAVVSESGKDADTTLLSTLKEASWSHNRKLFKVTICSENAAKALLDKNKISGYIIGSNPIKLIVMDSGINQTIIQSFLDSYSQMVGTVEAIMKEQPDTARNELLADIRKEMNYVVDKSGGSFDPDTTVVYYYALIAMTCLFGSLRGLEEIISIQADLSAKGARIQVSPMHKMKLLLCNLLAAFTVQLVGIGMLMAYLCDVLKVNFGNNLYYVGVTCFISSLLGVMLGAMVGALVKKSEHMKRSILQLISTGGSFLAGLMIVDVKYMVETKAPAIAYLNPASLITDALYRLYYYGPDHRFYTNISILSAMSLVFVVITYFAVRSEDYASI
jgi:ABC-type multidrug transport system, permease component